MLVRAQSVILWDSFLSQPITPEGSLSNEQVEQSSNNIHQIDGQIPIDTDIASHSMNKGRGIVTDISSATINVSPEESSNLLQEQISSSANLLSGNYNNNQDKNVSDVKEEDDISFADQDIHSTKNTTTSSIISSTATSSLLDKPIPTYYNLPKEENNTTLTEDNKERSGDGLIYYKRREDFFPPQQHHRGEDENGSITPSNIANSQQNRRQTSIRNGVLGQNGTTTRSQTVNEGMPVFKPSTSSNDIMLKPKTMFKRLKTMVKTKSKKRRSTSTF